MLPKLHANICEFTVLYKCQYVLLNMGWGILVRCRLITSVPTLLYPWHIPLKIPLLMSANELVHEVWPVSGHVKSYFE